MYAYATLKEVTHLENDTVALQFLVHKLKDKMETIFSTEFTKRMETQLTIDNDVLNFVKYYGCNYHWCLLWQ